MAEDSSLKEEIDRAIAVGVGLKTESLDEVKESLYELEDLIYAAGGELIGSFVQIMPKYQSGTLIGTGKLDEIKDLVDECQANLVVFDHLLTGSQSRNLEKILGARVLDRSQLILDIFAQRAQTYEGKLQVELAQMLDQLPRMVGGWLGSLSRLGGGIGTRGPGETALELDRRRIRDRIKLIRKKLDSVRKNRSQHRAKRSKRKVPSFALIGYTNSGKSTLLNKLTKSEVFAKDQVFATLDPTTRKVFLEEIGEAVVTDTVGFIKKLPTKLIEAFKATLEESAEADVLLHVIDLSNDTMERQVETVNQLIQEFKWQDKPIIHVFNKVDVAPFEKQLRVKEFPRVLVSAKTGKGLEQLKKLMIEKVYAMNNEVELFFPNAEEYKIYDLGRAAQIVRSEKGSTGTIVYAKLTPSLKSQWKNFLVEDSQFEDKH